MFTQLPFVKRQPTKPFTGITCSNRKNTGYTSDILQNGFLDDSSRRRFVIHYPFM